MLRYLAVFLTFETGSRAYTLFVFSSEHMYVVTKSTIIVTNPTTQYEQSSKTTIV